MDTLVGNRPELRQREDLEAPAIGQDRLIPVHELMKATGGADNFAARAEVQVVGVAE